MSEQSQAVLLLTAWLGKPGKGEAKPLAPREWGRFALWLKEKGHAPDHLLRTDDVPGLLQGWSDRHIDAQRIQQLLERGTAMGISLEKWERAGLWIITRSDPDYPSRLKRLLKTDAPPVLFGAGNRKLLDRGGIAVVGSRDVSSDDLAFTKDLGKQIALDGKSVVSGGARGVDEAAMLGALESEGTVIGILADSLLRASTSAKYRSALMEKNLVLISPFNPEAGFDVGNAMARNKYIYCLADAAVVISTSKNKGGTWSGAIENLKHGWVPIWIKSHADIESGNAALVDKGAHWLPENGIKFDVIIGNTDPINAPASETLFDTRTSGVSEPALLPIVESNAEPMSAATTEDSKIDEFPVEEIAIDEPALPAADIDLYEYFLLKLEAVACDDPQTVEALQEKLGLVKTQLSEWLKRAITEGRVEKTTKPVLYQIVRMKQLFN